MIYNPKCPYTYGGKAQFNGGDAHMQRVGPLTACEGPHQPASEEAKVELKMCALIVCRFVAVVSKKHLKE